MVEQMQRFDARGMPFCTVMYDAAMGKIERLDGVYIRLHPGMANDVAYMLDKTPQRVPLVLDSRAAKDRIEFRDAQTGTMLVLITGIEAPQVG